MLPDVEFWVERDSRSTRISPGVGKVEAGRLRLGRGDDIRCGTNEEGSEQCNGGGGSALAAAAVLHWWVVHRAERLDRCLWSHNTSDIERRNKVFHPTRDVC